MYQQLTEFIENTLNYLSGVIPKCHLQTDLRFSWNPMRGQDYFYSKIVDDLNLKIGLGEYSVGMFLPYEKQLANQYEVSISTVRKALSELEQRGFVKTLNGKGTIVIEPDDTKLHQLALNSGYVEKALRYLHALQLMVLIIRPAALAAVPQFTKEELEEIIQIALEMRRRVKEQLKKLGGMEFYDVNFSYIDLEDMSEHYVSVPEQGGGKLIPDGMCNPGQIYTVSRGKSGMIGVFRLESQMLPGNGKIERTGLGSDSKCKEAVNTAFNYLKANGNRISGAISTSTKDYIINYQDLQGIGMTDKLALPTLIALCSIALGKPVVSNLAVLGDITISGTMIKVDELANTLQVCLDSGAKKVLIPSTSFVDFASVPADLMSAFQLIPYQSAEDAVFKALGVE